MTALPGCLQAGAAVVAAGVDIVAIAGIVGTLLGTILGAVITWKVQQRQFAHEDSTRFHDRRLAVYAEFTDACPKVVAERLAGTPFLQDQARLIVSFETLRLVATAPVAQAATQVHGIVHQVIQSPNPQALVPQFNINMALLGTGMRAELGVQ